MPDAEIIAVGSELLTPQKIDTNSLFLTDQLNALGVEVVRKTVVGDDRQRLADTIRTAAKTARIILLTGGLGPTEDDVTRDAVAAALDRRQDFRQDVCDQIEERFRRFNRPMAEINKRQAYVVQGAEVLPNERGTAPGQWIEHDGAVIVLLPGPPNELKSLFTKQCLPRLERLLPPQVIRTLFLRVAGMGESDLDQLIAPVYTKYTNPSTTILAAVSDIQIHLRARCNTAEEAEALLAEVGPPIEALLGDRIYSRCGDALEAVIGQKLRLQKATLSVAESATGGMLGERITNVAGSSAYFSGGFITYTDEMKAHLLGVDRELIRQHTAVSAEVVKAMAEGARARTGSTYALSVSGEAGPESSTANAVGVVFIGIADENGSSARRLQFPGDRSRIRGLAVQTALDMLRLRLG